MKEGMYSVYDRVAQEFSAPVVCKNDGVAFRMFRQQMEKTPEYAASEYWLMRVAQWDAESGEVKPEKKPVRIEKAVEEGE